MSIILPMAAYWIEEFHFDGLRFDATQDVHDNSHEYIIGAIGPRTPGLPGNVD